MASREEEPEEVLIEESEASIPLISQCVNVYSLPDYYSNNQNARRSDPGVPRIKIGSLSSTEDLLGAVKKLAPAPGAYLAELRLSGRVADSQVYTLKPQAHSVEMDSPQPGLSAVLPSEPIAIPANDVEKRLMRIESALLALATQATRSPVLDATSKKPVDEMRDAIELVKQLQLVGKEAAATNGNGHKGDDEERALLLLLQDASLRSKITSSLLSLSDSSNGASRSWPEIVGDVFARNPKLGNRALNTIDRIVFKIVGGNDSESALDEEMVESPDDNVEDEESGSEAMDLIKQLLANLAINAPVAESVNLVRGFSRIYPDQAPMFGMMIYAPTDEVLKHLVKNFGDGATLAELPHARAWIESLQKAMRESAA
jgi:hypothetical protein